MPVFSVRFHLQHDTVICVQRSDILCLGVTFMLQLVTVLVGHNDFCSELCYVNRTMITENVKAQLEAALNYLQTNMPRVLINLLLPLGKAGIKGTRHRKCTLELRRIRL
jgi:lysophospholipase L1-like esterase